METLRGAALGSSAGQRVMKLREAHREKVARNEVRVSPLWAHSCRAYNVHIELDPRNKASLKKTQQVLKRAEPTLVACPQQSLHVSIAWLLAVHASYTVPKDSLWAPWRPPPRHARAGRASSRRGRNRRLLPAGRRGRAASPVGGRRPQPVAHPGSALGRTPHAWRDPRGCWRRV